MTTETQNHLGLLAIKAVAKYRTGMLTFTAAPGYIAGQAAIYEKASPETREQSEYWHFTAHETAKLLIAARDIVIIRGMPYWEQDVMDAEGLTAYDYRLRVRRPVNWDDFIAETMTAAGEFNVGEEMDTLCDALIAAGAREIES